MVQAFLDEGGTIVVPAFSYWCEVSPPAGTRLERNGGQLELTRRRLARPGIAPGAGQPGPPDPVR